MQHHRRPKPRPAPREPIDSRPPPDWEPKSDFFKAIWRAAEARVQQQDFDLANPRVSLTCPCCGESFVIRLTMITTPVQAKDSDAA